MLLIRLNFHLLAIDHSDRTMQHFQVFVQVLCCTYHTGASRVELLLQQSSKALDLIFWCRNHKIVSMAESIHKL